MGARVVRPRRGGPPPAVCRIRPGHPFRPVPSLRPRRPHRSGTAHLRPTGRGIRAPRHAGDELPGPGATAIPPGGARPAAGDDRQRRGIPGRVAATVRGYAVRWLSDEVLAHLRRVTAAPDLTGTRYELVEQIGRGGMGTVYLARDRELDRPVALKVLDVLPEGTQVEARVLARLEHPGIVPVHDAGVLPDGRFFYVMKLVR